MVHRYTRKNKSLSQRTQRGANGDRREQLACREDRYVSSGRSRSARGYNELILARNSPFDLVLLSLSISNSMASTGDSGFSTLRKTQMRVKSSFGISNSSFRVPDR